MSAYVPDFMCSMLISHLTCCWMLLVHEAREASCLFTETDRWWFVNYFLRDHLWTALLGFSRPDRWFTFSCSWCHSLCSFQIGCWVYFLAGSELLQVHDAPHLSLWCSEVIAGSFSCCWRPRVNACSRSGWGAQGCCAAYCDHEYHYFQGLHLHLCSFSSRGCGYWSGCSCVVLDGAHCLEVAYSCSDYPSGWYSSQLRSWI